MGYSIRRTPACDINSRVGALAPPSLPPRRSNWPSCSMPPRWRRSPCQMVCGRASASALPAGGLRPNSTRKPCARRSRPLEHGPDQVAVVLHRASSPPAMCSRMRGSRPSSRGRSRQHKDELNFRRVRNAHCWWDGLQGGCQLEHAAVVEPRLGTRRVVGQWRGTRHLRK